MTRVTLISSFSAVSGVPGTSSVRRWSCPPRVCSWTLGSSSRVGIDIDWRQYLVRLRCGRAFPSLDGSRQSAHLPTWRPGSLLVPNPMPELSHLGGLGRSLARSVQPLPWRSALASLTSSRTSSTSSRTAAAFGGGLVWRCRSCRSLRICASRFEAQGKHRFMFRWASLMSVGQSAQVRVSDSKFCPPFLSSN